MTLKSIARAVTPPVLWDGLRSARTYFNMARNGASHTPDGAKPAQWYNENFPAKMRKHYSSTHYYCFWTVIVDRMVRCQSKTILDVGCGSGQFANFLYDKRFRHYYVLNFNSL